MDVQIKQEPDLDIKEEPPETNSFGESPYFTVIHSEFYPHPVLKGELQEVTSIKEEKEVEIHDQLDWEPAPPKECIQCDVCNRAFTTVKGLHRHYKVHTITKTTPKKTRTQQRNEDKVECEVCFAKFPVGYYSMHINKKHPDSVPFETCELCPKRFRGKLLLERHYKLMHRDRERPCDQCQIVFRSKVELHRHIKAVHFVQKPMRRAECSRCGIRFEPENNQSHMLICKSSKRAEYPFMCYVCKKLFKTEIAMVRHMPTHGTGEYKCDVCSKTYPALAKMKTHLLTTHFKKTPIIPCKFCHLIFNKRKLYIEHMPLCHKKNQYYKCDMCDKVLRNDLNLRRHKESCNNSIKQFKCEICQSEFHRRSNLIQHQLVHFKNPFSCDICPKLCKTEQELEHHKDQHSYLNELECKECFMVFKQKETLERHIKYKHLQHEKFSCEHCGKEFSYKPGLGMHLRNYIIKKNCNVRNNYHLKRKKTE